MANVFEYWGGAANKITGETIPIVPPGLDVTLREPVGVCALITPVELPGRDRELEDRPGARVRQHRRREAGVADPAHRPRHRRDPRRGRAARGHAERAARARAPRRRPRSSPTRASRRSAFTGSTEVGTPVMQAAATNITRVSLELGGKSANVVFDDADLDACIEKSLWSVFDNAGQDCCARSRQFVQRPIYDEYVERFAARTEAIAVGEPLDESTEMGPLISSGQRADVARLPRDRHGGGRASRDGRRAARRRRVLPAPGRARRRRQRLARRPGGDLRPGRLRDPVRHRGGGRPARERLAVRSLRLDLDARPRPRDPGREGHPHRRSSA